ncbi:MAG: maleylpyruvate isomerase family mycothiol-dependent enzyme [Nocardiopsaceae bacterium]|jgi:uncharacterized protein (TIGR03083 family)|nr:maleylpyruvate isomerase family mycothiol-dependent enzyme [Nocardiopsaceae bacterium]
MQTPSFSRLLDQIADRSAAFLAAAGQAPPGTPVPGCPDWSVADLLAHLGEVQRFWAAVVAAGPGQPPPGDDQVPDRVPSGDPLAWSATSTQTLLAALTEAGPDRGCWTWWQSSPDPQTSGAVARHQVHEAAVHARDAQQAIGQTEPLPADAAADGVAEFITVGLGAVPGWAKDPGKAWPHAPGRVELRADDGGYWLIGLRPDGAALLAEDGPGPGQERTAALGGSASDLLLFLYGREPAGTVRIAGDRELVTQLTSWAPTD